MTSTLAFTLREAVVPVLSKEKQHLLFPVRRIYCIGQNYESHAKEMGGCTNRAQPFFFTKPADTLVTDATNFSSLASKMEARYPTLTESYHHEVEMVVALGPRFANSEENNYNSITVEEVKDIIYGYGVGLDMTRRDLQLAAKQNGLPWDLAKGAEEGALLSSLVLAKDLRETHPTLFVNANKDDVGFVCNGDIALSVNGKERQKGNIDCMVSNVAEIIAQLSKAVTLRPGDLIYTGTPSGVAPVRSGDAIEASIAGIGSLSVKIV